MPISMSGRPSRLANCISLEQAWSNFPESKLSTALAVNFMLRPSAAVHAQVSSEKRGSVVIGLWSDCDQNEAARACRGLGITRIAASAKAIARGRRVSRHNTPSAAPRKSAATWSSSMESTAP
jgi:hypothetical protein